MAAKKKKESSYWDNLAKEFKQFNRARQSANQKEVNVRVGIYGTPRTNPNPKFDVPGAMREKGKAHKKEKSALGQLAGAALQGRRYKGNKQVKNTKKK